MTTSLHDAISLLNDWLTIALVFPGIFIVGLYFTYKLNLIQVRKACSSVRYLLGGSSGTKGTISPFQAISAVLAGNLGTGNISGMAVALSTGGPGSLVWMWLMAFLGAAIQYSTCFLGATYRRQNAKQEFVGGPMYYLSEGTSRLWFGKLFALFTIFGAFTVGNLAQIHSLSLPIKEQGYESFSTGIVIAFFVALVIFGGIQRVARVASTVVPVKALLYLGASTLILVSRKDQLGDALSLIFNSAFSLTAFSGGVAGFSIAKTITVGFGRGIFATDAGTGIVPILQASAKTDHPVITGVIALLSPIVVMMVCTATALVLLTTGAWTSGLESTNMVTFAFEQGLSHIAGRYIVIGSLMLFAYTTIIAWAFCMDRAVEFLIGEKAIFWVRLLFVAIVPFGAMLHLSTVWALADVCISLMVISNLIGMVILRKEIIESTRLFFNKKAPSATPAVSTSTAVS